MKHSNVMSFSFNGCYVTLYLPEDIGDQGQHRVEYICRSEDKTLQGYIQSDRSVSDVEHWGLLVLMDAKIEFL